MVKYKGYERLLAFYADKLGLAPSEERYFYSPSAAPTGHNGPDQK